MHHSITQLRFVKQEIMQRIILSLVILFWAVLQVQAGGFIIVMPDQHQKPGSVVPGQINPHLFPLEARSLQVNTTIEGQTAQTTIKQVFFNPTRRQLEGYFLFPVPKDVVISKFTMNINGVPHEAELLDATKARSIYEAIVRRSQDPALLEYYGKGMFRVRIFPILPQKEQQIELTYTETLAKDNQTISYHFPLNTKKYAAKPIQEASFKVVINSQEDLKSIYCPTHEVEVIRKSEGKATVGFESSNLVSDRDFQLYFSLDNKQLGLSSLHYKAPNEDGYFFMNLSPGFGAKQKPIAKDIVFVMDKSGSMVGEKLEQAKKALRFCVENLNPDDRFELIPFSTEANPLFGKVEDFNKSNKAAALKFIDEIKAIGGTNIEEALDLALKSQEADNERPFFIIFMTDGKPTIGETNEASLLTKLDKLNQHKARIFTFGIGTNLNTHLLDKLTANTNAYRTYVLPDEDIEVKVSDFYTKASSPILTNVEVVFDKTVRVSEVYDKQLPDLFKGGSISLMGRYKGSGKSQVTIKGLVNGKPQSFKYTVDFEAKNTKHPFISDLWASRAVGYLLDQIRLHGEQEELVQEVTRLAKKHGIITPYTSYLIIEDEAQTVQREPTTLPQHQLLLPRVQETPEMDIDFEEEIATFGDSRAKAAEQKKSGRSSVNTSVENQALNKASNLSATKQGTSRLQYKDQAGQQRNLSENIVNIQGRAWYQNGNSWTDANVALNADKNLRTNRVQFNSSKYYELLKNEEIATFLSLGQEVRFLYNNEIYEIYVKS